jgi:Domain of unknown function (DUF4123)
MVIDRYSSHFQDGLDLVVRGARNTEKVFLLIDGGFIPGLYREFCRLYGEGMIEVLFDQGRPCTEEMRSVSPFLCALESLDGGAVELLNKCNGKPMLSVIVSHESLKAIAERLSQWCLVENDAQLFNFRYADTRCLPNIFASLTRTQRSYFCGGATVWRYVGRDGEWRDLDVKAVAPPSVSTPTPIVLDSQQFVAIVNASEADEIIAALTRSGRLDACKPSLLYASISEALMAARELSIDESLRVDWCDYCMSRGVKLIPSELEMWRKAFFDEWV